MKRAFQLIGYGVLAIIVMLAGLVYLQSGNGAAPPRTKLQTLAERDAAIEHDCRLQVTISPECQAALDRLDLMRELKHAQ